MFWWKPLRFGGSGAGTKIAHRLTIFMFNCFLLVFTLTVYLPTYALAEREIFEREIF